MILGMDKLQAQLKALEDLEYKATEMAVASLILEDSQALVPIDTGELKDSGSVDDTDGVKVIYTAGHALFVEMGTYKMNPQPYLRPAVDNNKNELTTIAANGVEAEIRRVV